MKSIHGKYSAELKPLRESVRAAMQEARSDRQKGDTAAARAVMDRTKNSRVELRGLVERERTEIRASLSPANQTQFDTNVQQVVDARGNRGRGGMGEKRGKRTRTFNG